MNEKRSELRDVYGADETVAVVLLRRVMDRLHARWPATMMTAEDVLGEELAQDIETLLEK